MVMYKYHHGLDHSIVHHGTMNPMQPESEEALTLKPLNR